MAFVPEFLSAIAPAPGESPGPVLVRLVLALLLGIIVAVIYKRTRPAGEATPSFTATLVLLSVLIAMVTQVIGDNVARAFSLVGALSIVRFRTVVRDTEDTAFVIFAVAVGMAVGSSHPTVAVSGIAVVGIAALVMSRQQRDDLRDPYRLEVRVGLGHDVESLVREPIEAYVTSRRLMSMATARQGMALEVSYRVALRSDGAGGELVKALNRIEGVQSVSLQREPSPDS
jgi:uncharacterized membrane protein YhiD involved in acid resistance